MKRQLRFALFLLLLVLVVALFVRGSSAERQPDALTIGSTEFGVAFINSAEQLRSITRIQRGINTGAQLDRFPLYWNLIEPTRGQFDWSGQDAALRANEQQGLGTLAILLGTSPAYWPSRQPIPEKMPQVGDVRRKLLAEGEEAFNCTVQGTPAPSGLHNPIFSDGTDNPAPSKAINSDNPWARFVEKAVLRYQPGGTGGFNVRYWEVWNEPDLCHFWGGSSQDYTRMLKVAYLVIKNIDADATVMWAGLALYGPKYDGAADFLAEMVTAIRNDPLAASYNGFFDAAAVHHYSDVVQSYRNIGRIKNELAGTGWENKPIWVTESGVPVCDSYPGPSCPSPFRANSDEQAAYIWQNVAYTRLATSPNNGPIFHFQLHDDAGNECRTDPPADGFGLFTNEPGVPCVPHNAEGRLAYSAFRLATQYFPDTELSWDEIQDSKIRQVAFYHPASQERRVLVWAIDNRGGIATVPATSDSARRISLDGSEVTITPINGTYNINVPPATNQNQPGSSSYTIGGKPYLLIEKDTYAPTTSLNNLLPVSPPTFNVTWQAIDRGSGVQDNSVTVLYQAGDNGQWETWLSNQPASGTASFTGEPNVRYRFGVLATDRAGNRLTTPIALAETLINDGTLTATISGQVVTMRNQPASWAVVSIGQSGVFADAAGRFSLNVPLGQWDIKVQGQTLRHGVFFMEDATLLLLLPPNNNAVVNGDFEVGSSASILGWQSSGSSPQAIEELPNTQENVLRLGSTFVADPFVPGDEGAGSGGNSTISQRLRVPAGNPYLSLVYKVESAESDGGNGSCGNPAVYHDKFEIVIGRDGQPSIYIHCQEVGNEWQYGFFDLSAYAGQEISLIFNLYQSSASNATSAQIDLVTIGESPALPSPKLLYLPLISN